jgi:phage shock protein A
MRFIDRLMVLVRADAHAALEQLEERSLLAKQHLREAELELTRKRARGEALDEEVRRLGEQAVRLEEECATLDADVELALAGGREELARFSLRRLLPKRRAAEEVRRRSVEIGERRTRLARKLEEQEAQFAELRRSVRARLAAADEEQARGSGSTEAEAAVEEVELELLRRRGAAQGEAR